MVRRRRGEAGQAVIVLALLGTLMFGMAAIALDSSIGMSDRRDLQAVADDAALAGVRSLPKGTNQAHWVATQYLANALGFSITGVSAQGCSGSSTCPAGSYTAGAYTITYTDGTTSIDVSISHTRSTIFGGILGFKTQVTGSSGRAVTTQPGSVGPAILGLSTDCSGHPPSINITGGSGVTVTGDIDANGQFIDTHSSSVTVAGNANTVCSSFSGQPTYAPGGQGHTETAAVADPGYPQPPSPSASGPSGDDNLNNNAAFSPELGPEKFGGKLNFSGGCYFLDPGVYEFDGSGGFANSGGYVTNELTPPAVAGTGDLWTQANVNAGVDCSMVGNVSTATGTAGTLATSTTYSVELTSTRTDGAGRESAVSGCLTLTGAREFKVTVPNVIGAQGYNLYAGTGGCSGTLGLQSSTVVTGLAAEREGSLGTTLIDFASYGSGGAAPPTTDRANEGYSVGTTTTPGAVAISVIHANTGDPGVSITSGGVYIFSGLQYSGVIAYDGRSSTSSCNVNCNDTVTGGAGTQLIGFFYAPHSNVSLTGGSATTVTGQVVGQTVTITGGSGGAVKEDSRFSPFSLVGLSR